ncbi:MAG: hypothetical protein MJ230_02785 [bacterium]|nr:hypothetical protein [bacterium]
MKIVSKLFGKLCICLFMLLLLTGIGQCAENSLSANAQLSFTIASYTHISPVTSPVLTAHITDKTGNLYAPLSTTFRVITNSSENKKLYLKANVLTRNGYEEAMFEQGGQVYIAFANLKNMPNSAALAGCKSGVPADSPGIVAYPVTSITGTEGKKYINGKNKYELEIKGGTSYVTVNVGSSVLPSSFGSNDPRGYYQAVLSLTEADI